MAIFVHQSFKDDLKNVRADLQEKYNLKDIDTIPNAVIIERLIFLFSDNNTLRQQRVVNDTGNDYYISLILNEIKSIDDAFLWTNS